MHLADRIFPNSSFVPTWFKITKEKNTRTIINTSITDPNKYIQKSVQSIFDSITNDPSSGEKTLKFHPRSDYYSKKKEREKEKRKKGKKRWGDVIEGVTIKFNPGVNESKAILGGIKVHGVPSTFFRAVDWNRVEQIRTITVAEKRQAAYSFHDLHFHPRRCIVLHVKLVSRRRNIVREKTSAVHPMEKKIKRKSSSSSSS